MRNCELEFVEGRGWVWVVAQPVDLAAMAATSRRLTIEGAARWRRPFLSLWFWLRRKGVADA